MPLKPGQSARSQSLISIRSKSDNVLQSTYQSTASRLPSEVKIKKWRKCLRCCESFGNCCSILDMKYIILIGIIAALLIDTSMFGLWVIYKSLSVTKDAQDSDVGSSLQFNEQLIVVHIICYFSDFVLYIGIQRAPGQQLCCISWIVARIVWLYYSTVAWIRALNFDANFIPNENVDTIETLSLIVMFSHWLFALVFAWIVISIGYLLFGVPRIRQSIASVNQFQYPSPDYNEFDRPSKSV